MKTFKYLLTTSFILISFFSFSQTKAKGEVADKIEVSGNCGMCRSHIVKAAKQAGASYAEWNKDTKILSVKYDAAKTSNLKIQEQVAKAGYDTKDVKGDNKAYEALDECCKYDRKPAATKQ